MEETEVSRPRRLPPMEMQRDKHLEVIISPSLSDIENTLERATYNKPEKVSEMSPSMGATKFHKVDSKLKTKTRHRVLRVGRHGSIQLDPTVDLSHMPETQIDEQISIDLVKTTESLKDTRMSKVKWRREKILSDFISKKRSRKKPAPLKLGKESSAVDTDHKGSLLEFVKKKRRKKIATGEDRDDSILETTPETFRAGELPKVSTIDSLALQSTVWKEPGIIVTPIDTIKKENTEKVSALSRLKKTHKDGLMSPTRGSTDTVSSSRSRRKFERLSEETKEDLLVSRKSGGTISDKSSAVLISRELSNVSLRGSGSSTSKSKGTIGSKTDIQLEHKMSSTSDKSGKSKKHKYEPFKRTESTVLDEVDMAKEILKMMWNRRDVVRERIYSDFDILDLPEYFDLSEDDDLFYGPDIILQAERETLLNEASNRPSVITDNFENWYRLSQLRYLSQNKFVSEESKQTAKEEFKSLVRESLERYKMMKHGGGVKYDDTHKQVQHARKGSLESLEKDSIKQTELSLLSDSDKKESRKVIRGFEKQTMKEEKVDMKKHILKQTKDKYKSGTAILKKQDKRKTGMDLESVDLIEETDIHEKLSATSLMESETDAKSDIAVTGKEELSKRKRDISKRSIIKKSDDEIKIDISKPDSFDGKGAEMGRDSLKRYSLKEESGEKSHDKLWKESAGTEREKLREEGTKVRMRKKHSSSSVNARKESLIDNLGKEKAKAKKVSLTTDDLKGEKAKPKRGEFKKDDSSVEKVTKMVESVSKESSKTNKLTHKTKAAKSKPEDSPGGRAKSRKATLPLEMEKSELDHLEEQSSPSKYLSRQESDYSSETSTELSEKEEEGHMSPEVPDYLPDTAAIRSSKKDSAVKEPRIKDKQPSTLALRISKTSAEMKLKELSRLRRQIIDELSFKSERRKQIGLERWSDIQPDRYENVKKGDTRDPKIMAQNYIQEKGIVQLFQQLTTKLIIERPSDPLNFLILIVREMHSK